MSLRMSLCCVCVCVCVCWREERTFLGRHESFSSYFPIVLSRKLEIRDGTDVDQSENRGRRFQSKSRMQCQTEKEETKTYDVQGSNEILLISTKQRKENGAERR